MVTGGVELPMPCPAYPGATSLDHGDCAAPCVNATASLWGVLSAELPIQNKRVGTGRMQPSELIRWAIDRDCFDVMPGTNRGELDGAIQITPVD